MSISVNKELLVSVLYLLTSVIQAWVMEWDAGEILNTFTSLKHSQWQKISTTVQKIQQRFTLLFLTNFCGPTGRRLKEDTEQSQRPKDILCYFWPLHFNHEVWRSPRGCWQLLQVPVPCAALAVFTTCHPAFKLSLTQFHLGGAPAPLCPATPGRWAQWWGHGSRRPRETGLESATRAWWISEFLPSVQWFWSGA